MIKKDRSADGLRGVASLNVAISHFIAAFIPTALYKNYPWVHPQPSTDETFYNLITSSPISILYNGHFAVMLFFVISGYVLTMPYFKYHSIVTLKKRMLARYLRLNIPISVAILLSYLAYHFGLYSNIEASTLSDSVWLSNYFLDGISITVAIKEAFYSSIIFGDGIFIPPLWSLGIEFVGSLLLLLFFILKPKDFLIIPMIFAFIFIFFVFRGESIYYMAIFAGSLLNLISIKSKHLILIIFVIGLYFGSFQFENSLYNFLPSSLIIGGSEFYDKNLYNVVGAIFITMAVINGFSRSFFESQFILFLGRISFALYLIHFIVLCSLTTYIYIHLPINAFTILFNFVIYLILSLTLAHFFEKTIDRNAIHFTKKFTNTIFKTNTIKKPNEQ